MLKKASKSIANSGLTRAASSLSENTHLNRRKSPINENLQFHV